MWLRHILGRALPVVNTIFEKNTFFLVFANSGSSWTVFFLPVFIFKLLDERFRHNPHRLGNRFHDTFIRHCVL